MIKSIYFPDKVYSNKEELHEDLKANLDVIIASKKAQIQKSCEKGISVSCKSLDLLKFTDQLKGIKIDDNFWYIAVNTTRILDSHDDLHLDGIWNKSIKDQQGQNYLVADHELRISDVIVKKEYVEMFVANIPFSLLGKDYEGNTQALIYKVPKDKVIHDAAKNWLESGDAIEGSVRMQYVNIMFALDSNHPDDAAAKKNYDDYIDTIANKKDFEYISYFFPIKEAKNVKESSLVVLGSNSVTGSITNTKQAEKSLEDNKEEPTKEVTPVVEKKKQLTFI